jgi:hypothetical protein
MTDALQRFVLEHLEAHGALVERPAYNVVELLLPDELTAQLETAPYLLLAFGEEEANAFPGSRLLTYGHPLVDRIIEMTREEGKTARWYVNDVRLEKRDLFEIVKKEATLPNAWVLPADDAAPQPRMHYYVRFNFKIALLSDEKEERLASVLMDLNRGLPAMELEAEANRLFLEREPRSGPLAAAPLLWRSDLSPLSLESLALLQERAAQAVTTRLGATLRAWQGRAARRLELDLARLQAFYDDTESDLQRRLERSDDPDQQQRINEKLAFARSDREHKIADARAKYQLRLVLELVNAELISQPKLALAVRVENRYVSTRPTFVWDPLLHRLEPPLCACCGRPDYRLHLCANGHLACDDCTTPCSVCNREFCKLCEKDMGFCAVCRRAVCVKSQARCAGCGAIVCPDHRSGECHAPVAGEEERESEEVEGQESESARVDKRESAVARAKPKAQARPERRRVRVKSSEWKTPEAGRLVVELAHRCPLPSLAEIHDQQELADLLWASDRLLQEPEMLWLHLPEEHLRYMVELYATGRLSFTGLAETFLPRLLTPEFKEEVLSALEQVENRAWKQRKYKKWLMAQALLHILELPKFPLQHIPFFLHLLQREMG